MPIRPLLLALTASLAVSTAVRAASITVWSDSGFRGASTAIDSPVRSLLELGWNDRISSLRVDSGRWEVCRDVDFRACRVLDGDHAEISSLESGWNDAISSLRPLTGVAASSETPEQVAQRLYRAILGRDADPEGLRNAIAQIARGQIETLVRGMTASAEYRNLRADKAAPDVLDQMHRALLGRPADTTARRNYLAAVERGEDAAVVLALLASDQYGAANDHDDEPVAYPYTDTTLEADGAGLVVWGGNGRYESLSGARAVLGRDGVARIDLPGTTPQALTGRWTRDTADLARVTIPEIDGRRADARGIVLVDKGRLARVEVLAGVPGTRSSSVMTFVADGYRPPLEETRCHQEVRARIEDERGSVQPLLFLAPERSPVASGRDQLAGDVLALAELARFGYRCQVDTRRSSVLEASVERR